MLYGEPFAGKTTMMLSILADIFDMQEFLGQPVEPFNVVYLTEEDKSTINYAKNTVRFPDNERHPVLMMQAGGGHSLDEICKRMEQGKNVVASEKEASRNFAKNSENAISNITPGKQPTLFIIDTVGAWADIEDANSYSLVRKALQKISNFSHSNNITVLATHHVRKGGGSNLDSALGSTAWNGVADNSILFTLDDQPSARNLFWKGRGLAQGSLKIAMEDGRYSPVGVNTKDRFYDLFAGSGEQYALATKEISELTGLGTSAVGKAMPKAGYKTRKPKAGDKGMKQYWYRPESAGDDLLDATI